MAGGLAALLLASLLLLPTLSSSPSFCTCPPIRSTHHGSNLCKPAVQPWPQLQKPPSPLRRSLQARASAISPFTASSRVATLSPLEETPNRTRWPQTISHAPCSPRTTSFPRRRRPGRGRLETSDSVTTRPAPSFSSPRRLVIRTIL